MLSRLAFDLLAGKPIASAARALMRWSFSRALVSDHTAPYREFTHLVRLNRSDWIDTRTALLQEIAGFRQAGTSSTGKRALVTLLESTGDLEDATQARALRDDLTSEGRRPYRWRLIEDYCATDPCDPTSERPDNLDKTVQRYQSIDVSKIRLSAFLDAEDHVLSRARTGMARFEAPVASDKYMELARHVASRTNSSRKYGVLELSDHNALLTKETALSLLSLQRGDADGDDGTSTRERWEIHQFSLLAAFPFLSDSKQIEKLLSLDSEEGILLDLLDATKSPRETEFDSRLEAACRSGDEYAQFILLSTVNATSGQISNDSLEYIAHLAAVGSERVRDEAFGVMARLGGTKFLDEVIRSNLRAVDGHRSYVNWYGSWNGSDILAQAVVRGLIEPEDALDRMDSRYYARAVETWGRDGHRNAVRSIALRVDDSLRRIAKIETRLTAPDVEMQVDYKVSARPRYSIPDKSVDLQEEFRRVSETDGQYEQRQKRHRDAFLTFKDRLTDQECHIILDHFGLDAFRTMTELNLDLADRWYELLMDVTEAQLPVVYNFVLLLAHALDSRCSARAAGLFRRIRNLHPMVRVTMGLPKVPLEAMAIWGGSDGDGLEDLRFQRLDGVGNDHVFSQEVLAAHLSGMASVIRQYIDAKLEVAEPAEVAHALMAAGFSDHSQYNENVLNRYGSADGFIGEVHDAARYAYDRNRWARHWFERMCGAHDNVDFWRFSILFTKIVDGRFDLWRSEYKEWSEPMRLFWPSVKNRLRNRLRKWENKRKSELFGQDVPDRVFLRPWRVDRSKPK